MRALLVIEDILANTKLRDKILKNKKLIENTGDILVFTASGEVSESDELVRWFRRIGKAQKFAPLKKNALQEWLASEFREESVEIGYTAIGTLADFIGSDLWRARNEIDKLVNYRRDASVHKKDVEDMVKPRIEVEIFKTIDSIASRNKVKAIRLLEKHLEKGDNPLYLFKMIIFQLRNILLASQIEEKGKGLADFIRLGIAKPYPARKAWYARSRFSSDELVRIYRYAMETDKDIKLGSKNPEEGLIEFIIRA